MKKFVNKPIPFEVEEGRYYFKCNCGMSESFPFCDGSHAGTGKVPLSFQAVKTGTVQLCACGKSTLALCNDSHGKE